MKYVAIFSLFLALLMPVASYAQGGQPQTPPQGGGQQPPAPPLGGGQQPPAAPADGEALQNPLSVDSITGLLTAILDILVIIAVPIIVFFIIFAGFKYVTARGNEQEITTAHHALAYAVIGGVLILGATAIAAIVKNLVDTF
jgi:hypothetical protein